MHDGDADAESTRPESMSEPAVSSEGPERDARSDTTAAAALAERVAALERAVAERESPRARGADSPAETGDPLSDETVTRLEELDDRFAALHERLDELDAAVQALRGYAGGVRAVNEEVERRADLALATARSGVSGEPGDETRGEPAVDPPEEEATRGPRPTGDRPIDAALPDQPAVAAAVPDTAEADAADGPSDGGDRTDGLAPGVVDRLRDAL
ncbi:DUF7310 family coiled-coil domain-containing protein [Haloparvum sedimenti]|uniref:DUF7310 family coiled-coil domain-containing protein n=1 Tax=Haloparvum sedimenti TaxID=1678448 RepID=UPI00071E70C8|nr:hypothetical protein [Haloparvum sedimenti]